ncbi:MAG: substrate-binding domain-containing protein [Clostridiales bacterium]|nr:substrate-binding domain-containing protein [Clostridiales bacterium]
MRKTLLVLIAVMLVASLVLVSCGKAPESATPAEPDASDQADDSEPAPTPEPEAEGGDTPYIAIVSKGFQHQFWQTVAMGSEDAAKEYDVEITFDGPPSESDISVQIDQINAVLAKNPAALALAALDTESVTTQLLDAKEKGIPVIGFDSGVPDAPEGTIVSTASTDNEEGGALAANEIFKLDHIKEAIENATAANPVVLGIISQDATSASVVGRTVGFLNKAKELAEAIHPGAVAITGHDKYKEDSANDMVVELNILVPATTNITDAQTTAQAMLEKKGLISLFLSNELAVGGVLAATSDGQDLNKDNGKYKDITVVGFDAGKNQKVAVRNGWFYGSVTQDPYMIGYKAVELAVKAINGEPVDEIVDTGCQFYTADNMDDASIAPLLYD